MIHVLRTTALLLLVALAGCGPTSPTSQSKNGTGPVKPTEVGADLYARAEMPKLKDFVPLPEPLIASQGVIQFDTKIQVPAEADGRIEILGTPLPPGTVFDPNDTMMVKHPRDPKMLYRRLKETMPIVVNQTLARIDETQVVIQLEATKLSLAAAIEALTASKEAVDVTRNLAELFRKNAQASKTELSQAETSYAQAKEKYAEVLQSKAKYEGDRLTYENKIDQYQVKSRVDGRILKILKFPGEYVKAGEPIMEVQATGRFRVEAKIDNGMAKRLTLGMPAIIEPARPFSPEPFTAWHRSEVTGVAVTSHKDRPLIVSSSLDSSAKVWDVTGPEKKTRSLVHPSGVAVRCVATTGPQAIGLHLAATGGSDGKVRIWDLSNPDNIPQTPREEYDEAHGSAIVAIAFSPDGNYLATAAGRDVFLWDLAGKKKKYALPADFRDDVTSVRFTPQCSMIVTARDKTVRIYTLGTAGAALDRTLENRSGSVDVLGVSADGGRMLFDQDAARIDVIGLGKDDLRTIQTLQNSAGVRFSGLALFSPDDKYALTGAGETETKGELQLWKLPDNGARGSERRRLITPNRSPITAAAFSGDPTHGFVVVGTQGGGVYYWNWSSASAESNEWRGTIATITEVDSRYSQVRVEVENPAGNVQDLLQDRGAATIIIDQKPIAALTPTTNPTSPIAPAPTVPVTTPAPTPMVPVTTPEPMVPAPISPAPPKPLPLPGVSSKTPDTVPDVLKPGGILQVGAVEPAKDTVTNPVPAVRTPPAVGIDPFRTVAPPVKPTPDK